MENKLFRMAIKEMNEAAGTFNGYLSVFGNVDHGGDLVEPGAFKKTLSENKAYPLLWAHSSQEPRMVVGAFHGQEDRHGLLVEGDFFMDQPGGKEAHDLVKRLHERGVRVGLSIGYKAVQWKDDRVDEAAVRRLKEIQLFEGSLTLFPMNDEALVQAVKEDLEQKPYPNNHACVIDASSEVVGSQSREHDGKKYTVRIGKKKGGGSGDHSYLYPIDTWTEAEARAHCKSHDGTFEAASKSKMVNFICGKCGEKVMEIIDPEDQAFDKQEPEEAIPAKEPPAESQMDRAWREFIEQAVGAIKKITN